MRARDLLMLNEIVISIIIVSKSRKVELDKTLSILEKLIDFSKIEILVYLDGYYDDSYLLKEKFSQVNWYFSENSIGASAARNKVYSYAKGDVLIGLDDDAHPLTNDFITKIINIFDNNPNVGIIAFEEIKGIFNSDSEALHGSEIAITEYLCNEFIGCGFAIKKSVYEATNGFPLWVDIYGEESCVAIEVLDLGFDIMYSNQIKVNHRIDKLERKKQRKTYFRFGEQLKNTTFYYLVYYRFPYFKIFKLYWHNLKKYGLKDFKYCGIYFATILFVLYKLPVILHFRRPVKKSTLLKLSTLNSIQF